MRALLLAGTVLLGTMFAGSANAGFILIDDFESPNGGIGGSPGIIGPLTRSGGQLTTTGPAAFAVSTWSFASTDFRGGYNVVLDNLTVTGIGADFDVVLLSDDGTHASAGGPISVVGGGPSQDLVFNFSAFAGPDGSILSRITGAQLIMFNGSAEFTLDEIHAVPEPASLALIGLIGAGGSAVGWRRRKRSKRAE